MDPRSSIPPVSIVMAVYNQIQYTKQCLETIYKFTSRPFEIIIIDNASTDGTEQYLKDVDAVVIRNATNLGCAVAWNQGIRLSRGRSAVILNNDVLVTPGWLEALVHFMEKTGHGVVSPSVREGALDYDLLTYSKNFTQMCSQASRTEVIGCCMLIHQSVFNKIGLFDEQFFVGHEDTDFLWRCRQAGFTVGMTGSAFVHHFSQITQKYLRSSVDSNYRVLNEEKFFKKWGKDDKGTRLERLVNKLRRHYWSVSEKLRYGHTLIEK